MEKNKPIIYTRTSGHALSKWQSVVHQSVRATLFHKNPDHSENKIQAGVFDHPMVLGNNILVDHYNGKEIDLSEENVNRYHSMSKGKEDFHPMVHAYIGKQFFDQLKSVGQNFDSTLCNKVKKHLPSSWTNPKLEGFPDSNYAVEEWCQAALNFSSYGDPYPSPYINVKDHSGDSSFATYQIKNDAKIAIIGDFGTGLNDAASLLYAICTQLNPDYIIHLGDIYYSGTRPESIAYLNTFRTVFKAWDKKIPVFSLPGNHEYITGGYGYFNVAMRLNNNLGLDKKYHQQASYFSLTTEDKNWQLLGMDTGYNSVHCNSWRLDDSYSPWLDFDEADWLQSKLANFNGKNILFSHHQLFSSHSVINDGKVVNFQSNSNQKDFAFLNQNLLNVFSPHFSKVAAWFWGHEHSMVIFEDGQEGLAKGRLVGNSGYEDWVGEDPYTPASNPFDKTKNSPYQIQGLRLGTTKVPYKNANYNGTYDFLNHSCALIDLKKSVVDYYQYPYVSTSRNGVIHGGINLEKFSHQDKI